MTVTEGARTDRVRDLIAELLVDDIGREALTSILLEEISRRTIQVRGLEVMDPLGRKRIEIDATESAGEVKINGFSSWPESEGCNYAIIGANEESTDGTSVYVALGSGDNLVAMLTAAEEPYGLSGVPTLELERYERTHAGNRRSLMQRRSRVGTFSPEGSASEAVER